MNRKILFLMLGGCLAALNSCETGYSGAASYPEYYDSGFYDHAWYDGGYYNDPDLIVRPPGDRPGGRPDLGPRPSHPIANPGFGGGSMGGGGFGGGGMGGGGMGGGRGGGGRR